MVREIRLFGDPILLRKTREVERVDGEILSLISDMKETIRRCDAIGLAANQVGVEKAVFLLRRMREEKEEFIVVINPHLIKEEGKNEREEGCLSLPEIEEIIVRPSLVVVEGMDEKGVAKRFEFRGIFARAAKHEIDHLAGRLFIDYLSPLRRKFLEKRLEEIKRRQQERGGS